MLLSEIIKILEKEYPKHLAFDWDNVGLMAGNPKRDIKKVLVSLDVTPFVVQEAISEKADLIISHHPLIFNPIKTLAENNSQTKMYINIIQNNIAVYSAHTNMDIAPNGINAKLAELFDLAGIGILDTETGLGRFGDIPENSIADLALKVKKLLKTPALRFCADEKTKVKRIAIASGACSDLIPNAIAVGADVLITGDIKYHDALDAAKDGLCLIDAGHFPTEIIVMDMFEKLLKNTDLTIIKSKNKDIFSFI